ncbi:murein biosynthesis integral membrane protein MurJ [Amaricoccus macauensis]|uniref:murein biosynthesis integral membrane protein MurJ n=1 Tax=Amaricoccus macauensis TaxID=57001 RepID=UPI003C7C817E
MRPIRLLPAFLTVGSWTMLSRVLGLARDVLMAAFLGTGPVAQAFLIAFTLPNMFRRFFAEGAFNMAFVPIFAKKVEAGEDPLGFARDAFSALASFLIGFTLLAQLAMPWLVLAMASGFAGDERYDLSVFYGRIAFPYILFISLTALLSGVLNALGRFSEAAAAPILMNVVMITFLLAGYWSGGDVGLWQIWSVPVAGVAQFALVWWGASRAGFRLVPRLPRLTPDIRRLAMVGAPALLTGGVVQINLLVGRQVGSFFDGAVAWLSYADRLYQLPLGVVGVAIGVVLLPDLSRRLRADDVSGARNAANRATELTLALTVPAALALLVIPAPIVSVLFERGEFSASDTAATAIAVMIYGAGLPAFVLQKVYMPMYYAREDSRTPLRFTIHAMIVNAVAAIALAPFLGFSAAALGTTLAGWTMLFQLWNGTRAMGEAARWDAGIKRAAPRIVLASVLMAIALIGLQYLMADLLADAVWRYGALFLLVAAGGAIYLGAAIAVRALVPSELKRLLRRNSASSA